MPSLLTSKWCVRRDRAGRRTPARWRLIVDRRYHQVIGIKKRLSEKTQNMLINQSPSFDVLLVSWVESIHNRHFDFVLASAWAATLDRRRARSCFAQVQEPRRPITRWRSRWLPPSSPTSSCTNLHQASSDREGRRPPPSVPISAGTTSRHLGCGARLRFLVQDSAAEIAEPSTQIAALALAMTLAMARLRSLGSQYT